MAKKKSVKKKNSGKKKVSKKGLSKKVSKKSVNKKSNVPRKKRLERKIKLVLKNLFSFVVLGLISLVFYFISGNSSYENVFGILAVVFGFVSLALFISYLILFFMKKPSKKK